MELMRNDAAVGFSLTVLRISNALRFFAVPRRDVSTKALKMLLCWFSLPDL